MCHCEMPESCVIRLDDVRDNRFSKKREPWDGQALPGWGEVWVGPQIQFRERYSQGICRNGLCRDRRGENLTAPEGLCWKIRYFNRPWKALENGMGMRVRKKAQEEGCIHTHTHIYILNSWFTLLYGRNQHNIVKQLSSQLKIKF